MIKQLENQLKSVRDATKREQPLIHCITNPISIHGCANMILAVGARPMMAEHPMEVEGITKTAGALMLNLGNITDVRIESMKRSARMAAKEGIPYNPFKAFLDTGFCVNAKVADEPEKMEAIDKFLSFALSAEGAQIYTDNDKSPSCVTGVKAEVPQFQPFFDYVEANGFEADGAYPPTGFEDTKRGKIQNVLLDKDVDAFLKEMTNDWNQAVEDSK